jgi:hypothetical protein
MAALWGGMRSDDEAIRGEMRHRGFRRVSHGLFLPERAALSEDEEFLRDLRAWIKVLPPGAVFTHVTAARLLGWRLPRLPESVPVFASVHDDERRPRRSGLICSRLGPREARARTTYCASGLPVDEPEEVLLRAARDLGHLDLLIVLDSARAHGSLDSDQMMAILRSGRPGVRALRAAYEASDPRSESSGETLLRRFHEVQGIPVIPQVPLAEADGTPIGRADLHVAGSRDVHEYDGAGHRSSSQHRSDLRRDRRLSQAGYVRRGFTLDDLTNHPAVTMHELDRALGRAHRTGALRTWRRMLDESLYSEAGRARLLNRWRRAMGAVDWA